MDLDEAIAHIRLLEGRVESLEQSLVEAQDATKELKLQLLRAQFENTRLRRALFGDRSERLAPEELLLPGIDLSPGNDVAAPDESPTKKRRVREHERDATGRKTRERLALDPARVTDVTRTIDSPETCCPQCAREMPVIGEEKRVTVERDPSRYTRTTELRLKRACGHCKCGVFIAPAEDLPTGNGIVGPSLAVDIAVMHFHDHLPFHRICSVLGREGLSIDRSTVCRAASRVAKALAILVSAMEREMLSGDGVVGVDGTGVKVFATPHCARRTIYVVHGGGHVVFRALRSVSADQVLRGFKGFAGVVESDAAKVHLGSVSVTYGLCIALCNAHARRKFVEARDTDRERADHALRVYQEVAREEKQWRDLAPEDRRRERERVLRPKLDAFKEWLLRERPSLGARTPMAEAFDYTLRHWEELMRFLSDGRVPWTNNESERLLRHVVVGRKSWVFRGTFGGVERGCVLWSLMMSYRAHGLDPRRYLLDVLAALDTTAASDVLSLTPREYARRQRELAAVA